MSGSGAQTYMTVNITNTVQVKIRGPVATSKAQTVLYEVVAGAVMPSAYARLIVISLIQSAINSAI